MSANGTQLYAVHKNWASRPDDQRFLTLEDLEASVAARTEIAKTEIVDSRRMELASGSDNALVLVTPQGPKFLTHWTFGQLCSATKCPASFLRDLPAEKTQDLINYRLQTVDRTENLMLYNADESSPEARAITSTTYGRIWDLPIVQAVRAVNAACGDRWVIPSATYGATDPKRATTLYASDRDIFIFLCDQHNPVTIRGEELLRGFYVSNSEVGAATFVLAQFLYRKCCDNRIIWGAENITELKIKHTSGAPERFRLEGAKMLRDYAESSTKQLEEKVTKAQNFQLGKNQDEVKDFLTKFGLTASMSSSVIEMAKGEEGSFTSAWDIANGLTAKARSIAHTDARVDMERMAGKLLDKVTK